jgi:AcrR family transcriptional regulator
MPRVIPGYKEEARQRILSVAAKLFAEKGFRQTSMEEVAEKLGVSRAALYLYFDSKENLFHGIYESFPKALREILESSFKGEVTDKTIEQLFDKLASQFAQNPSLSFEIFSEASHNKALKESIGRNYEEYVKILSMSMKKSIPERAAKASDLRALSLALIALWNGMETLMIAGISVSDAKKAWTLAFASLFSPIVDVLKKKSTVLSWH